MPEEKEQQSLMYNIFERLGNIDAKLDGVNQIRQSVIETDKKADEAQKKADEALASTKSAHHRLNKIDKIIWWVGTTIIGAVIVALVALVIKTN